MSYKGKSPYQYDKSSKSFKEGAFKNWTRSGGPEANPNEALADRKTLEYQRRGAYIK